mgnify:CR=1 FL=1
MKTLEEHNLEQRREAKGRWELVLELRRTMTTAEIAMRLNITPGRVRQMLAQARQARREARANS